MRIFSAYLHTISVKWQQEFLHSHFIKTQQIIKFSAFAFICSEIAEHRVRNIMTIKSF